MQQYGGKWNWIRDLVGKSEGKNHLEDPGVDGSIILMLIFKKFCGYGLNGSGWGQGQVTDFCEHGKETSGFVKYGEILD
jgi:hypothetical protein